MRISDWSSDVCSSDLAARHWPRAGQMRSVRVSTPPRNPPHLHLPEKERSEEHTSELQSLMRISYAVFCLKKKTTSKNTRMDSSQITPTYHVVNDTNLINTENTSRHTISKRIRY